MMVHGLQALAFSIPFSYIHAEILVYVGKVTYQPCQNVSQLRRKVKKVGKKMLHRLRDLRCSI